MSIADKLSTLANNIPLIFEAGEKKHTMLYSTCLKSGDDTNIISFPVSFKPDCIIITAHGAYAIEAQNAVQQMVFDSRSFARYGGMYRVIKGGSRTHGTMSSTSGGNYFRWNNGTCEVECPSSLTAPYPKDSQYICVAVKYTDKDDKTLLTEEVSLLADSGDTVKYSKARINATVTDDEWQIIIASKPNRTFSLS